MRHGQEIEIGGLFARRHPFRLRAISAVRDAQAAHRGAQRYFPAALFDGRAATFV